MVCFNLECLRAEAVTASDATSIQSLADQHISFEATSFPFSHLCSQASGLTITVVSSADTILITYS